MRNIFSIGIVMLLLTACGSNEAEKTTNTTDSLSSVISDRDSALMSFIYSFNEIESNLDSVAAKQKIIFLYSNDKKRDFNYNRDKKDMINAEIDAINTLMDKNRKEIDQLTKKLSGYKTKNAVLEKTIKTLTIQLSQKEYELCELNIKLSSLNSQVATLVTEVDSLASQNYIQKIIIDYQTTNLHAAYYIVENQKGLMEKKIIDKKGGLLGIGKTATLSKDLDNSMFTAMDYTKTTEIAIDGKDVKLITSHPSDSYLLEIDKTKSGIIKNLTIINPEKFWSVSKYLVIVKG